MATGQMCCHLPGEMLNLAAKVADSIRVLCVWPGLSQNLVSTQASWVTSISQLGLPFGAFLSGFVADIIGRRKTALLIHTVTHVAGFALIALAENIW
jgi:MFS family permease